MTTFTADTFIGRIAALLEGLDDVRFTIVESADNGEHIFVQWMLHAVGEDGHFSLPGVEKIGVRDGKLASTLLIFDAEELERKAGHKLRCVA
jgi:hypothetical protein